MDKAGEQPRPYQACQNIKTYSVLKAVVALSGAGNQETRRSGRGPGKSTILPVVRWLCY